MAVLVTAIFLVPLLLEGAFATECSMSPMDINFLIDTSDDTSVTLFDQEKIFTANLINAMWDGKNRFGLFTFGSRVFSQFHLDTYTSATEVQDAMQYIWKATGKPDVAKALQYIIKNGFLSSNGGRVVAPDIVFLLTSSDIRNETLIRQIEDELHSKNIELNVVIVGSYVSTFWYEKLAASGRILRIKDADSLALIADRTKTSLCKGRGILGAWTPWSACGSSCGYGLQRRYRTCEKRHPDDDDCDGELLEERDCQQAPCTDPINGVWSLWGKWSICSKTCGNGYQRRIRTCSAPFPENGGKNCSGGALQTQNCSDWSCPDCNRQCPHGSKLSAKCDVCICSDVTLFGKVQTFSAAPINDAGIYLNSKLYEPITTTNVGGEFSVEGICMVDEKITVKHSGYSSATTRPRWVNMTHWHIDVNLTELVLPVFIIHPEEKVRLAGQGVTLCCLAMGSPAPSKYTWFKGTDIINGGENGSLIFNAVSLGDSGKYQCMTETKAGSTRSNQAVLTVNDGAIDSCNDPTEYIEELPVGCFVKGDASKSSTIDVRTCGQGPCVSKDLLDNNTCTEWWPFHCCDTAEREAVDIMCDGFTYQTTRIKSCKCKMCFTTTTITGKAFGYLNDDTETPLKLGTVHANGQKVSRTNMKGIFSFEVPRKLSKLVLEFTDDVFKKFIDTTKIVYVTPGSTTAVKLALPLKPIPIPFNSSKDFVLDLGGSSEFQPAGSISIPNNSLVTIDGKPFTGQAVANVHFMDPRKLHDFESANGEFINYEDGTEVPLETFGVISSKFEDSDGNPIICNKPMSFEIDPTVFNISSTSEGEPMVSLWHMDQNTGSWVFGGDTKYKASNDRRRAAQQIIVGTENAPVDIPRINLYDPTYEQTTQTYYERYSYSKKVKTGWWNWDRKTFYASQTRTRNITVRGPDKAKRNACYISVKVYKTFTANESAGQGIQVTAVTKDGNVYKGYDRRPTDRNGHVCLSIFCDATVYLSAENNKDLSPLRASPTHDLPRGYTFKNIRNGTQVELTSRNTLEVITDSGEIRFSPVYYAEDDEGSDRQRCLNKFETDFKFQFALSITKDPKLDSVRTQNEYNHKLSWYPTPPDRLQRKYCFIKTFIKIRDNYDIRFFAKSYQGSMSGGVYGTYNAGPLPEPTYTDMVNRAVCLEFRCPGLVNDNGKISTNVSTTVEVRINPRKPSCRFRPVNADLSVTEIAPQGSGFFVPIQPERSYGPKYGVYIATGQRDTVERFCFQGRDTGTIGIGVDPAVNTAVEYDCT